MKNLFYITCLVVLLYNCGTQKNRSIQNTSSKTDTIRIANDSLEYEIIIIEPGFNNWLVTQRPRGYYSIQFLETRNQQYVIEYNQRVIQPFRFDTRIYEMQINYQSNIDYGYEVNYLLYHYFLFIEQRYGQQFFVSRRQRF